jgi:hypothetical protein
MENFPGQGKLAINGPHPPPPPGLMTFAEFKAKFEHRVRALLMVKEQKMPTIEKVNFMINHEYSTYIQRNVKPKKVIICCFKISKISLSAQELGAGILKNRL